MQNPQYSRNITGETEYSNGECWFTEQNLCHHCKKHCEQNNKPYQLASHHCIEIKVNLNSFEDYMDFCKEMGWLEPVTITA